jgi:hypothetical protein
VIVTAGQPTPPTTTPPPPPVGEPGPYELYCPGTPVGNIVLNNVTTTGSIPSDLTAGQSFQASDFQTQVTLPSSIASAAAALGNTAIAGTAVVKVDGTGVTPATVSSGAIDINVPLPSPVPATGIVLSLPATPGTVGPFTATGGDITLTVDPTVQLTLVISGSNLVLSCNTYPNNSAPTGIVSTRPGGARVSPVIATGSTAPPTTTPPTTLGPTTPTTTPPASTNQTVIAPSSTTIVPDTTPTTQGSPRKDSPATTATVRPVSAAGGGSSQSGTSGTADPVVSASSRSLAFTGIGAVAQLLAIVGGALVLLGFALLTVADAPRRLRYRLAHLGLAWRRPARWILGR